jgi:lipoprotein-releasing system permease protein
LISSLEKEITFRYLKTKKKDGFLNIISIFSFIGISLGVAVLIIVMSVMNGFRIELINKIVGFNAHVTVKPYENSINLDKLDDGNLRLISKELIFSNSGESIIISKDYTKGLILRGYNSKDFQKLDVVKNGKLIGETNELIKKSISIGKELSFNLGLSVGDKVSIMSSSGIETIIGSLPKQEIFNISSIFESGLTDFDANIAFINLDTFESFFDVKSEDRNLEIYLNNPSNIEDIKIQIQKIFNNEFVYTWADKNSSLFSALKVERNVMFIILSLIIVVAAFNIISGLTILVKNKTRDIAILKSIGVLNKSITKIFFLVGVTIGTTATFFGIFIGVIFSLYIENLREFLSNTFNISLFPEEIYFLSTMPSEINPTSIFIISLCSILTTIIVSIFPAIKASKLDPVKGLKYE